jgi:uncharacterized membrane protein (UPF0127 family)
MKIRTAIISSILALALIGLAMYAFMGDGREATAPEPEVNVQTKTVPQATALEASSFDFEVVASPDARAQGLSGRTDVPHGYGMLFVFDQPDRYGFWMKDMLVAIDIIWLASDGTIVGIEESVSPSTYPTPFYPSQPVKLVLETRAGEARAQGWGIGTRIALPL